MNQIMIFFFVLLPFMGISQTFINKSRKEIKKELAEYSVKNDNLETSLTETDSSISMLVTDPRTLRAKFIYSFDKSGKCISEKTIAWCDSCLGNYLEAALNRTKYGWIRLNENQYISKFSEKMMLETPIDENDHSFLIFRMDWSKMIYDMLLKK